MDDKKQEKLSLKGFGSLLKDTFNGFMDDKLMKLSGALAYFTIFSMGPLLVVIIALCSFFLKKQAVEGKIYGVMQGFVGKDTAASLQDIIKNAGIGNKSTVATVIGLITLLIGATSVFAEIQDSINGIWGLTARPKRSWLKFLQDRFLSFSVIISLGFLLLVSLGVSGIIDSLGNRLQVAFPGVKVIFFYVINLILTFGISTIIFAVIFKVLPDAKIRWKDVFAGAIITAVLFMAGKFGISAYISGTSVGSTYGAAGSMAILLVWIYYSSIILYLGAEFTKAYAIKYGADIHPNDYAVTTKQVVVETGKDTLQEADKKVPDKVIQ